ncbi:MAG: protein kinase [Planctomycetia bacterium]|nr:protein kinase [Planctomycetia bacterium]
MPEPDPIRDPAHDQTKATPRKPDPKPPSGAVPKPTAQRDSTSDWAPNVTVREEKSTSRSDASIPAKIGRFEIRSILGQGAFGRVYLGFDPELEREVAIKVPHREVMIAGFHERFIREARAAANIHHPNVCPVYEAGTEGDLPFLVMHYVAGPTLSAYMARREGPFPVRQAVVVLRKLALGVAAAHAHGVVHRDLKPQNVLVDEARREVLITDFGVARVGNQTRQTVEGTVLGTPAYMSPEQARGKVEEVGPLSDVYTLGVILYRLLTGQVPYQGTVYEVLVQVWEGNPKPPKTLRAELDQQLNDLCLKAMARDPKSRFQSAQSLATALELYLKASSLDPSGERLALIIPPKPAPMTLPAPRPSAPVALELFDAEPVFDLPTSCRPMLVFMRLVAEAVLSKGLKGLTFRVRDEVFTRSIADETLRRYRASKASGLKKMLEVTACASIADSQAAAAQAAWEVATESAEDERLALEMYLGQLPHSIRQPLKRAEDPTGSTVPPSFQVESQTALAEILPRRVPRFRGGQPLPGRSDWVLVRWLGSGGFGEVWLVSHRRIPNWYGAVKFGTDLAASQRVILLREAQLAAQALDKNPHTGLVPLLDTELGGDPPWLMYEYVGGGELTDLILAWQQLPPTGRVRAAIERLRELAEAIAALHKLRPPVVHRDLKPSNILRDARTFHLRVTDFGMGGAAVDHQVGQSRGPMPVQLRGAHSLLYASPQQQRGAPPDPRDDVHALGVLAFHMLTGRLTSAVPTDYYLILKQLGLPSGLIQLLGECASADANHRPKDARELADRLTPFVAPPESLPATDSGTSPKPVIKFDEGPTSKTEILICPVCKARLQVSAGRTSLVPCPRCSTQFPPAAGRVTLPVRPVAPRNEPLSLDPDPEPELLPLPPPAPRPRRRKEPEERKPWRLRLLSCGCVLFLCGAMGLAGWVWQEEITEWTKTFRPEPVEFELVKEFEPGADEAKVYQFVSDESSLLVVTNSNPKDGIAALWDVKTGKRRYALKNCPADTGASLDPKGLQFRYRDEQLVVFNRDSLAKDKGGVWKYQFLPTSEEVEPMMVTPARRPWDVNQNQTRAIGEPKGSKVPMWEISTGRTITELSAEGTNFRGLAFTPGGLYVVGLCDESRLRVWDRYTGDLERTVRLQERPTWDGSEVAELSFNKEFTRMTVTTSSRVGTWDVKTGAVVDPMKPITEGIPLQKKYRLRVETGGRGTFSIFHDDFTLRAAKLTIPGENPIASWCLNDDQTLLAVSSRRKVQVWRLKYPVAK